MLNSTQFLIIILQKTYHDVDEGISYIIDKFGIMGVILNPKSIKFCSKICKKYKKSSVLKKKLN